MADNNPHGKLKFKLKLEWYVHGCIGEIELIEGVNFIIDTVTNSIIITADIQGAVSAPCNHAFVLQQGTTIMLDPPYNEREAQWGWGGYRQHNRSNSYGTNQPRALTLLMNGQPATVQIKQINVCTHYTNPEFLPKLAEWHIYGNEQQGRFLTKYPEELNPTYYGTEVTDEIKDNKFKRQLGKKAYELKDHLGNVRVTHSDIKMPTGTPSQPFMVDLLSKSEYYPYGMQIEELSYSSGSTTRYGYNGKEKDNEMKGNNNSLDFGARIYDPRVSRFLSQDPLKGQFAFQSPYIYAGDSPINSIDENGEYKKTVNYTLNKDGSHNVLKVSTDNSLKYWSIVSFGLVPVVPNTVEYVLWDDKGNKLSTSGDMLLENIGSTRYPGPFNPKNLPNGDPDYRYPPINSLDLAGMKHDKAYDANKEQGADGAFMSIKPEIIEADIKLVMASMDIVYKYLIRQKDPISKTKIGLDQAGAAMAVATLFTGLVKQKLERVNNPHLQKMALEMQSMMNGLSQLPSDLKEVAEESLNKMENELTPNP